MGSGQALFERSTAGFFGNINSHFGISVERLLCSAFVGGSFICQGLTVCGMGDISQIKIRFFHLQ